MFSFQYKLDVTNYKEYYSYLALHDKNVQSKKFTVTLSLIIIIAIIFFIFMKINIASISCVAVSTFLILVFFPKIFWSIEFSRLDKIIDKKKFDFTDIKVECDDCIRIQNGKVKNIIKFEEIVNFDYTKNNCMIFYKQENQVNTLIIPNHVFTDEELKNFHLYIKNKIVDVGGKQE